MGFAKGEGGRPKGAKNKNTPELREFAKSIIDNPKYRARIEAQMLDGKIHPKLEEKLWDRAYPEQKQERTIGDRIIVNLGFLTTQQPAMTIEVIDQPTAPQTITTNIQNMTPNMTPPAQVALPGNSSSDDAG